MHSQKSSKEILRNCPVKVRFAGFESTTTQLANAGWDLSMEQEHSYDGLNIRLAMRHGDRDAAFYGISAPTRVPFDMMLQMRSIAFEQPQMFHKFYETICFDIIHIGQGIKFRVFPEQRPVMAFSPFDASPMLEELRTEDFDIRHFQFFKSAPAAKELIVDPKTVPELLDLVLKIQSETNKDIKARERSRENLERMRSGDFDGGDLRGNLRPHSTVQAQIITLAV